MDVGNNRDRALGADLLQRAGAVLIRTGDADNVGTRLGRGSDLRHRAADIRRQRVGHGLHRNRGITANRH